MDKKTIYIVIGVLTLLLIVFIVYMMWPDSAVTQAALTAALQNAAQNVPANSLLDANTLQTIVNPLVNAYNGSTGTGVTLKTTASILQPLQTAAYSVKTQGQWAQVLGAYGVATQGGDLMTDVNNVMTASLLTGIFGHNTSGIDAVNTYVSKLPA